MVGPPGLCFTMPCLAWQLAQLLGGGPILVLLPTSATGSILKTSPISYSLFYSVFRQSPISILLLFPYLLTPFFPPGGPVRTILQSPTLLLAARPGVDFIFPALNIFFACDIDQLFVEDVFDSVHFQLDFRCIGIADAIYGETQILIVILRGVGAFEAEHYSDFENAIAR